MRVGINGMGRIGRLALRAAMGACRARGGDPRADNRLDVVHVNELKGGARPPRISWSSTASMAAGATSLRGRRRSSHPHRRPADRLFRRSTAGRGPLGRSRLRHRAGMHRQIPEARAARTAYFDRGVKRVIVAAPVKERGALNIVVGVNDHLYDPARHRLVTAASCTTNCLAPVVKVVHEAHRHPPRPDHHHPRPDQHQRRRRCAAQGPAPRPLGHAVAAAHHHRQRHRHRADLSRAEGQAERPRRARAGAQRLPDRLRVRAEAARPRPTRSTSCSQPPPTGRSPASSGYETRPLVSADYANDTRSSIVDGPSTMVTDDTLLKVYAWYDNEMGYACRMVDLANIVIAAGV